MRYEFTRRFGDGWATRAPRSTTFIARLAALVPPPRAHLVIAGGDREATIEVDVDAVGQILFNLVDNACKYGRAR